MSNFEIFLIVGVCVVPVVALLFVLPKFKKKQKTQPEVKSYEEFKKEETQPEPIVEEAPKETKPVMPTQDFTSEEFQNYLKHRNENTTQPKKIAQSADFEDKTMDYIPYRRRNNVQKPKNVAEEIKNLSPDLKALIISGVLDRKKF